MPLNYQAARCNYKKELLFCVYLLCFLGLSGDDGKENAELNEPLARFSSAHLIIRTRKIPDTIKLWILWNYHWRWKRIDNFKILNKDNTYFTVFKSYYQIIKSEMKSTRILFQNVKYSAAEFKEQNKKNSPAYIEKQKILLRKHGQTP